MEKFCDLHENMITNEKNIITPTNNAMHSFSHDFWHSFAHVTNVCWTVLLGPCLCWVWKHRQSFCLWGIYVPVCEANRKPNMDKQKNNIMISAVKETKGRTRKQQYRIIPGKCSHQRCSWQPCLWRVIIPIAQMRKLWLRWINEMLNTTDFSLCSFFFFQNSERTNFE